MSPEDQPPRLMAIARIIRPQGRRGEVLAEITTDFPDRFQRLRRVLVEGPSQPLLVFDVESAWPHKGRMVLKLAGVDSMSNAQRLRESHVFVPFEERVRLPEGSYYWSELQGCRVVIGAPGAWTEVGIVTAVEPTAGVSLLHVDRSASGHAETLIPLAEEICTSIDPGAGLIVINPPDDLLDLNDGKSNDV